MKHTTDCAPYHQGGRLEVEWTSVGVGIHALLAELGILDTVANQRSRDNHLVTSHNDDLLPGKQFLGNDGSQATKKVVTAVDNFSFG
mmetsp:Transcript_3590/g.5190  ORF Transcript_3590/g.5190 Transcript_3590/m.5190 type:complete len:87 (-) Transcript_3590:85-345(-)